MSCLGAIRADHVYSVEERFLADCELEVILSEVPGDGFTVKETGVFELESGSMVAVPPR